MTQVSTSGFGLRYPAIFGSDADVVGSTIDNIDTLNEQVAFIGRVFINGRPAAAKTISSAGGKIHFQTGTVTWATAGTSLQVGLQHVDTVNGPPGRGDGTFQVSKTLVQGTDTITTGAEIVATMSTGTLSVSHGDLIAVQFLMTVKNGSDQVVINGLGGPQNGAVWPFADAQISGSWSRQNPLPMVVIEFDDGTIGTLEGCLPPATTTAESYATGTNPNERGNIFQVPWDCKISGYWVTGQFNAATEDFTIQLYSTPTGVTPASVSGSSLTVAGETLNNIAAIAPTLIMLPAEVSLSKNTDYCVAIVANSTGSVVIRNMALGTSAAMALVSGGTTLKKATRNGSSGAFSATAGTFYPMGVVISSFDDGTGSGGGGGNTYSRGRTVLA